MNSLVRFSDGSKEVNQSQYSTPVETNQPATSAGDTRSFSLISFIFRNLGSLFHLNIRSIFSLQKLSEKVDIWSLFHFILLIGFHQGFKVTNCPFCERKKKKKKSLRDW